jgi:RsiW-degrading membrane proteinase PrsW (M82 family)
LITYQNQIWFTAVPLVLLSGLVQEGAKLLPVVVYWLIRHRKIEPVLGLTTGAVVGSGFGIFEAQWVLNTIFASGWSWNLALTYGFLGFAGFWERFFTVGFHISSTALASWGLSKGLGWQFYLIASVLHFLLNYTVIFFQKGLLDTIQIEVVIAIIAAILFSIVFWLRWRKPAAASA